MSAFRLQLEEIAESVGYGVTASACNEPIGPKFLRITDIQDGRVDWNEVPWCECNSKASEAAKLWSGDIVFARTGATTGKSFLIKDCPENTVFASYLIRVRLGHTADPGYVSHFFQTPDYWSQITKSARGAAQPGVNATTLKALQIPLPPLAEQKRLARILDAADVLRAKRRESLAQLDTLLQSTFLDIFGDPVTGDEYLFGNLSVAGRGTFSNGPFGSDLLTSELTNNGVPVVYIRDIRDGEYVRVSKVFVTAEKAKALDACQILAGDVLIAKVGDPPGTAAIYPAGEPLGIITQDVIRFRPNKDLISPEFMVGFLNSHAGRYLIGGITVEATRSRFGLRDLKGLTLRLPPRDLQHRFASTVESVEQQKARQRAHLTELDTLFASLQQRAFNGEL